MKADNEKKKVIVVVALAVAILCIGVFQFVGGGGSSAKPTTKKADKPAEAAATEYAADKSAGADPMKELYALDMPARDPFWQTVSLPSEEQPAPTPQPKPSPQPPREWTGNPMVSPLPPLGGSLPTGIEPTGGAPQVPTGPAYSVSGVIRGTKNAAVISDANGNQRLVREGQMLDGDARIVSVRMDRVVIRMKSGKTITLNVGGNP